jgi:hypothetical protein
VDFSVFVFLLLPWDDDADEEVRGDLMRYECFVCFLMLLMRLRTFIGRSSKRRGNDDNDDDIKMKMLFGSVPMFPVRPVCHCTPSPSSSLLLCKI